MTTPRTLQREWIAAATLVLALPSETYKTTIPRGWSVRGAQGGGPYPPPGEARGRGQGGVPSGCDPGSSGNIPDRTCRDGAQGGGPYPPPGEARGRGQGGVPSGCDPGSSGNIPDRTCREGERDGIRIGMHPHAYHNKSKGQIPSLSGN